MPPKPSLHTRTMSPKPDMSMSDPSGFDPELVEKLEAKISDIDEALVYAYRGFAAIDRKYQEVVQEYENRMAAVEILQEAQLEQRRDKRHASQVEIGQSGIKVHQTSVNERPSKVTWSEPKSRREHAKPRDVAENTSNTPSNDTAKPNQNQPQIEPERQLRSGKKTVAHEAAGGASPRTTVNRLRTQPLSESASGPDKTRSQVPNIHARSRSYDVTSSQPRSHSSTEPVQRPESGQNTVTKAKEKEKYVPRVTAAGEAIKAAERKERLDRLKAKWFGGPSKG